MYKIRTMNAISPLGISILEKHGCAVKPDIENPDIENPEALLIRSADLHGTEFWPELKCIGRAGAGTNNIPLERCSESGIVVFNAPGANADATKEMVIFQLLVASRDILGSIEWVKSIAGRGAEIPELVEKGKSAFAGPELCGKNLGVIGLGAIGVLVASTALKLGMTVRGYDPYMSVESAWRLSRDVIHVDFLEEIFRTSDYISLNVPYTESTHHMIDADAIAAMREAASGKQNIEVVSLPARYPQGFEKTLIYSLTGRIVPNGKLPSAAKCVVMNVGTCAALSAAVRKGQPLIDRVVTVTGRVANPANFRVRIGAPLLDLIDQAGGLTEGVRKLVVGGAMMGNAVPTLNLPITKNFGGFLALGEEAISAEESACIRCGRCMRACPMKLMPAKIDALVRHGDYDGAIAAGAMNCMECGSCTFACPAKRELTQSCRVAKAIARTKAKKS